MITVVYIAGGIAAVAVLIGAILTKKPLRALLGSALQGVAALAAVNAVSAFSGVTLGVTWFSAAVCGGLGIPGAVMLLVLQVIM